MNDPGRTLDAIKEATWSLHTRAERSGIIAEIFGGRASRAGVVLFLQNLLPIYEALEAGLAGFARDPHMAPLGHPALARSGRLLADLAMLGSGRAASVLPAAAAYRDRRVRSDAPEARCHPDRERIAPG